MRKLGSSGLVLGFILSLAHADDQADARAIVDMAIKAAGGEAKLAKFKIETWNEKGTYYGMGKPLPYTGKYAVQWPDRFRMDITGVFTMVVAGDKGWTKDEKGTVEMGKELFAHEKENLYGGHVATLLPLKNKAFTLTPVPETKVEGKAAVGVKVTHKGRRDVFLFFDKATGLLAKTEQMVLPPGPKAKEVKQETFLSDYQEFDGCKRPTKIVSKRDGKLYVEAVLTDIKAPEKLDEKLFGKP